MADRGETRARLDRMVTKRPLGATGLFVPILGLGAGSLGGGDLGEDDVARLLHGALDRGVTLVDAARSYGLAEERIGRHLADRRAQFVLSTKVGYGVQGAPDWTALCITRGIDRALGVMRTDVLDIVHLHSCSLEILRAGEVLEAIARAVDAGKVRVAAYSGENQALDFAVGCGVFGSVQLSVNLCDQGAIDRVLPRTRAAGLGVLAKRPVANAIWTRELRPEQDGREYWDRWLALDLEGAIGTHDWFALALRFAAYQEGVGAVLLGTTRLDRLDAALAALAGGPLDGATEQAIRSAWGRVGGAWPGWI